LPVDRAAIDWARTIVLAGNPAAFSSDAVLLLLREFIVLGDAVVRDAVEQGLTHALDAVRDETDPCRRVEWLRVLAEAAAISDDERLSGVVNSALPDALDALEALVRRSYEPGEGLSDGSCRDHLRCGSALLSGFDLSRRIPYAMLADELLQHARRRWWTAATAAFDGGFADNCGALSAVCRLAALHADVDYRAAAVVAPGAAYVDDARRMAASLTAQSHAFPAAAAAFGRALLEWFALESDLQ
jgi:hypothetical protein